MRNAARSAHSENLIIPLQHFEREAGRVIPSQQADFHELHNDQFVLPESPGNVSLRDNAFVKNGGNWRADIHEHSISDLDAGSLLPGYFPYRPAHGIPGDRETLYPDSSA